MLTQQSNKRFTGYRMIVSVIALASITLTMGGCSVVNSDGYYSQSEIQNSSLEPLQKNIQVVSSRVIDSKFSEEQTDLSNTLLVSVIVDDDLKSVDGDFLIDIISTVSTFTPSSFGYIEISVRHSDNNTLDLTEAAEENGINERAVKASGSISMERSELDSLVEEY